MTDDCPVPDSFIRQASQLSPLKFSVVESDPKGPEAFALLCEAAREIQLLYPEFHDPAAPPPTNTPTQPRGAYFVAFAAGRPVGMGAHRPLDEETTEVRRMFVTRDVRNRGVARLILEHVEAHALARGFQRAVLETGCRQLPAMHLYESCGYTRVPAFGVYANDPTSVCYAKRLGTSVRLEA